MLWSIVIPVLNEAGNLKTCLERLQQFRSQAEIIVVDGGSTDQSLMNIDALCDCVTSSSSGRAAQMNHGADMASGEWLLFLHADTHLPELPTGVCSGIDTAGTACFWGFFPVALSNRAIQFRMVSWFINTRSVLTRVATGDQAIHIRRDIYRELAGFANLPLMEDVEICKRLRHMSAPLVQQAVVTTSSRRWEQQGFLPTVFTMWGLRLAYFLGVSPERLKRIYYG